MPYRSGKSSRYSMKTFVPSIVVQGIIDLFEMLKVEEHQNQRALIAFGLSKCMIEMAKEQTAVW